MVWFMDLWIDSMYEICGNLVVGSGMMGMWVGVWMLLIVEILLMGTLIACIGTGGTNGGVGSSILGVCGGVLGIGLLCYVVCGMVVLLGGAGNMCSGAGLEGSGMLLIGCIVFVCVSAIELLCGGTGVVYGMMLVIVVHCFHVICYMCGGVVWECWCVDTYCSVVSLGVGYLVLVDMIFVVVWWCLV